MNVAVSRDQARPRDRDHVIARPPCEKARWIRERQRSRPPYRNLRDCYLAPIVQHVRIVENEIARWSDDRRARVRVMYRYVKRISSHPIGDFHPHRETRLFLLERRKRRPQAKTNPKAGGRAVEVKFVAVGPGQMTTRRSSET